MLAVIPIGLFFYAAYVSYKNGGEAGPKIGCAGIFALMVGVFALVLAWKETRNENVYKQVPVIGTMLSLLVVAGWCAIYILGWYAML